MYAPSPYRVDDVNRICALMDAFPFATLVRNDTSGPVAAYLPLARSEGASGGAVLFGHLAKANPFWLGADGAEVVALFSGPDGYISPSNYPSKQTHGKVVPTWNYVRVEVRGRLSIETSPGRLRHYMDMPTTMMERHREAPWSADDAPPDFINNLATAIVGIRIDVTSLEGSWKLDQRKAPIDRQGAIAGMRSEGNQDLANLMAEITLA
ncbi:MAG TPA: FMN-binding negative transcriptional regulator [Hyphomicrobiaceae bacterium]|nr:FMN-binding negative transcriptional regulator [Hyphomicrobiaceae bacterium]